MRHTAIDLSGGSELRAYVVLSLIGLFSGVLQGLLGIGGGVVIVPALVFFARFSQKQAQGASLWYVVPTSLLAGLLYTQNENVDIRLGYIAAMVAAAFIGATVGVGCVKNIRQRKLRQIFGAALIVISLVIVWRTCMTDMSGPPGTVQ